jgi:hypothetical protein
MDLANALSDNFNDADELVSISLYWVAKITAIEGNFEHSIYFLNKSFDISPWRKLEYLEEFPELLGKKYAKFNKMLIKSQK